MEDNSQSKEVKSDNNTVSNCYTQSIFLNELGVEQYKCLICKNICKTPVELTCPIHEEEDDEFNTTIVGKQCLLNYLNRNNNKCPINNHSNCEYGNNSFVSKQLSKQKVRCPNYVNTSNNSNNNNNNNTIEDSYPDIPDSFTTPGGILNNNKGYEDSKTMEGEQLFMPSGSQTDMGDDLDGCSWTGTLKQLDNHLKKCTGIKCLFKFSDKLFCNEKIINNDIKSHNKMHVFKHIELMRQYVTSQNNLVNSINVLQYNLKTKDTQIENLTQEIKQLKQDLDFIKKILSPSSSQQPQKLRRSITSGSKEPQLDISDPMPLNSQTVTKDVYISEFSTDFKGKKVNINKKNNLNVTGRNGQTLRFKHPLKNGIINKFSLLLNKIGESYIIGIVCGDYLSVKDFNYEPYGVKDKKNHNWSKSSVICISSDHDTCINGKWTTKGWNEQLHTTDICTFEVNMTNKNNRTINIYVNGKLRNGNDKIVINNDNKFKNWFPFVSFFNNKDNVTILQGN